MDFLLSNEKGLFSSLVFRGFLTLDGHRYLKDNRASMSPEDNALLDEVLPIIESMPVKNGFFFFGPNDDARPLSSPDLNVNANYKYGLGKVPSYGWYSPNTFVGKSDTKNTAPSNNPDDLGWTAMDRLAHPLLRKKWEDFLSRQGLTVGYETFDRAKNILKKAQQWKFSPLLVVNSLGKTEACAIFLSSRNGYLNDKGEAAALSGARLFESAEQARRTRTSRGLGNDGVIVTLKTEVLGLAPGETLPPVSSGLNEVLSDIQKKSLEEALSVKDSKDFSSPKARQRL